MYFTLQNAFSKKSIGSLELRADRAWNLQCSDKKLDAYLRQCVDRAMREGFRDLGEAHLNDPVRFPEKVFLLRLEEELAFAGVLMREENTAT
ncbi:MAG: hypothetical protein AAB562_02440 [Patescibacteria group bacterium]